MLEMMLKRFLKPYGKFKSISNIIYFTYDAFKQLV